MHPALSSPPRQARRGLPLGSQAQRRDQALAPGHQNRCRGGLGTGFPLCGRGATSSPGGADTVLSGRVCRRAGARPAEVTADLRKHFTTSRGVAGAGQPAGWDLLREGRGGLERAHSQQLILPQLSPNPTSCSPTRTLLTQLPLVCVAGWFFATLKTSYFSS